MPELKGHPQKQASSVDDLGIIRRVSSTETGPKRGWIGLQAGAKLSFLPQEKEADPFSRPLYKHIHRPTPRQPILGTSARTEAAPT